MRLMTINKGVPEKVFITVRNDEATTTLSRGLAAVFVMDGTRDGYDVVVPASSTAAKATSFFAGIMPENLAAGDFGPCQVYGLVEYLLLTRQTRATSTDSYASAVAVALGDRLAVETVANGMTRSDAGAQYPNLPFCAAAGTLASVASAASTTSDSSTSVQSSLKAFLHAM